MKKTLICPNCNSTHISTFYTHSHVPVHSVVLMRSKENALSIKSGDIQLGYCDDCAFIGNFAFKEELLNYAAEYESTQAYSPVFNTFQQELAYHLIETYDLYNKDIIEIGCGHGEFISLLCRLGNNKGVGFDPAYQRDLDSNGDNGNVSFIRDYYSEKYAHMPADFLVSKMTLEHIFDTKAFVKQLRNAIGSRSNAIVFVQVPDSTRILSEAAFWDIHYEHCCYFTPTSLAMLFQEAGFDVIDAQKAYHDTYLIIEAKLSDNPKKHFITKNDQIDKVKDLLEQFKGKIDKKINDWRDNIKKMHSAGQRMVLWGSSSKATAFLTTLGIREEIDYVVDINPFRQETFIPGTGQKIISPEFLKEYQPDYILVINPIYCDEVQETLESLGVEGQIITPQENPNKIILQNDLYLCD